MKRIILTSESQIKRDTVSQLLDQVEGEYDLSCVPTKNADGGGKYNTVEQPVSDIGTLICCKNRILQVLEKECLENVDAIISIENGIKEEDGCVVDNVHVIIYDCNTCQFYYEFGSDVEFDHKFFEMAKDKSTEHSLLGWNYTAGQAMFDAGITKDAKHWMLDVKGVDRHDQILFVLERCFEKYENKICNENEMIVSLGYDLHFKKGVIFKDIGPIMANHTLFNMLFDDFVEKISDYEGIYGIEIDYVLGIEARGFYLGPIIADKMGCAFVPVRKQGKLPLDVITNEYVKIIHLLVHY